MLSATTQILNTEILNAATICQRCSVKAEILNTATAQSVNTQSLKAEHLKAGATQSVNTQSLNTATTESLNAESLKDSLSASDPA